MKKIIFIGNMNMSYGIFIIITFILIGLFTAARVLTINTKPNADKKKVYTIERESNKVFFLLKQDSSEIKKLLPKDSVSLFTEKITMDAKLLTLNNNPKLLLWILMMAIMSAVAFGMIPVLLNEIYKLWNIIKPTTGDLIVIVIFIIIITIGAMIGSSGNNDRLLSGLAIVREFKVLFYSTWPINILIGVVTAVGGIALIGMFFINSSINQLVEKTDLVGEQIVEVFNMLGKSLKFFITFISILIMFSVITTSLLQQSLQNVIEIKDFNFFPQEFIYSYGLVFSIFLAAVYIPVHQNLKLKGEYLIKQFLKADQSSRLSDDKIKQLELKESPLKDIQILLTILSPILSGIFSEVLKHFT